MYSIVLSFFTSFFITFMAIPSIKRVATVKHLYDEPGGRKSHTSRIPTLGGVAIFAGLIFSFTFFSAEIVYHSRQYIVSAILILFFIGIKDDIIPIPAFKKLIGQFIAAAIIAVSGGIRITSMHNLLGIHAVSYPVSILITIFTIIVIINSFNLIDGIDGLAAGIGVIVAGVFGFIFLYYGEMTMALTILAFSLVGALLGFLYYNFSPARIFMGDTGSLVIGLVISVLAINVIELKSNMNGVSSNSVIVSGPAFVVTVLIIPLFDTLRVFCIRLINKKSPFSADRNHILIGINIDLYTYYGH
jgi:UDP-GlcNAc:undecaprenyl-phosphate GlcNAc-1-phosphate transferase